MDTTKKADAQALQEWLRSIPVGQFEEMKKQLISSCKIKKHTLVNWRYGNCAIPPLAKEKIEELAGKKIFES